MGDGGSRWIVESLTHLCKVQVADSDCMFIPDYVETGNDGDFLTRAKRDLPLPSIAREKKKCGREKEEEGGGGGKGKPTEKKGKDIAVKADVLPVPRSCRI